MLTAVKVQAKRVIDPAGIYLVLIGNPVLPDRTGIVCSAWWAEEIGLLIIQGRVPPSKRMATLAAALFRRGIYPPATGKRRSMVVCPECGRYVPPPAAEPVDEPGRTNGMCPDCVENRRPRSLLDELRSDRPEPAQCDLIQRVCFSRRGVEPDGEEKIIRTTLNAAHHQVRRFVREQQAIERRLIKSESTEQIEHEIALFNAGQWKPEFTPSRRPRKRKKHHRP